MVSRIAWQHVALVLTTALFAACGQGGNGGGDPVPPSGSGGNPGRGGSPAPTGSGGTPTPASGGQSGQAGQSGQGGAPGTGGASPGDAAGETPSAPPGGPDDLKQWGKRRDVKLDTTPAGAGITTNLDNYPVPVRLDKATFDFSQARPDGADLRFSKADGTLLPHEIELWDPAAGIAAIWVKTNVVGNDAAQSFVMHWGNPAAASTSNPAAVFPQAEGWVAAWHLGDDAATTQDGFRDATGVNHGTGHNLEKGANKPGRMGFGTSLDHLKNQGVKIVENRKNFDLAKNITFSLWAFVRSFGYDKGYESFMTKGDESWRYMRAGKMRSTEICSDSRNPVCVFGKSPVEFGKWHHFAGVHDGRAVRLYFNGKRESQGNAGADHSSNGDHPATLGFSLHDNVQQRFVDMIMDEARFTRDSKTDDWIKLDYESLREGSTFVSFGPVR